MNSATEQARYWMWTRRKPSLTNTTFTAGVGYKDSREEQAFAEDASGRFGGCVWPPRSYSCSFCRREFRSAQALGGHMNVHRRDRARLKQSPTQTIQENSDVLRSSSCEQYDPDHRQSPHLYPNQRCPIMLYSNSNHNFSLRGVERNLHSTTKDDCSYDQAAASLLVSPSNNSSSAIGGGRRKRSLLLQADENLKIGEIYLDVDRINKENNSNEEENEEDIFDTNSFKKLRTCEAKSSSGEALTSGNLRLGCQVFDHNPFEELDLELRLGDRPKDDVL